MASNKHVSGSEDPEDDEFHTPEPEEKEKESSQPLSVLSHRFRDTLQKPKEHQRPSRASTSDVAIAVMVSAPARPWEYQPFRGDKTVDAVLEEIDGSDGKLWYKIEYEDGRKENVSLNFCSYELKRCQFALFHPRPTL
jgi:hypothetical protein